MFTKSFVWLQFGKLMQWDNAKLPNSPQNFFEKFGKLLRYFSPINFLSDEVLEMLSKILAKLCKG